MRGKGACEDRVTHVQGCYYCKYKTTFRAPKYIKDPRPPSETGRGERSALPPRRLCTMRRDTDLDPRLLFERRAARGSRLRRMALPCVFLGQLLLFVTYVYCSEERPHHSPAEQVPLTPSLSEHSAQLAAEVSAPSESLAAERQEAAADTAVAEMAAAVMAAAAAETADIAEIAEPRETMVVPDSGTEVEDDETARRRREDYEDDKPSEPALSEAAPSEAAPTWAALRGRCLEKGLALPAPTTAPACMCSTPNLLRARAAPPLLLCSSAPLLLCSCLRTPLSHVRAPQPRASGPTSSAWARGCSSFTTPRVTPWRSRRARASASTPPRSTRRSAAGSERRPGCAIAR